MDGSQAKAAAFRPSRARTSLLTEENELWVRDPIECIWEPIGNPAFRDHMVYVCQQVFTDKEGETRHYSEIWAGVVVEDSGNFDDYMPD